jgi:hypothetical protein
LAAKTVNAVVSRKEKGIHWPSRLWVSSRHVTLNPGLWHTLFLQVGGSRPPNLTVVRMGEDRHLSAICPCHR